MTPQQAVLLLYQATRRQPLPADEHDRLRQAAEVAMRALSPAEEPVAATPSPIEELPPAEV